jgi:hypothetical protein
MTRTINQLLGHKTEYVVVSDVFGKLESFRGKTCARQSFSRLRSNKKEKLTIVEVITQ